MPSLVCCTVRLWPGLLNNYQGAVLILDSPLLFYLYGYIIYLFSIGSSSRWLMPPLAS